MKDKITAYALNELPPKERAALEEQMAQDPALREEAEAMKAFCGMLNEHVGKPDDETLTHEQRNVVLKAFMSSPRRVVRPPFWKRAEFISTAIAAGLALTLLVPSGILLERKGTVEDHEMAVAPSEMVAVAPQSPAIREMTEAQQDLPAQYDRQSPAAGARSQPLASKKEQLGAVPAPSLAMPPPPAAPIAPLRQPSDADGLAKSATDAPRDSVRAERSLSFTKPTTPPTNAPAALPAPAPLARAKPTLAAAPQQPQKQPSGQAQVQESKQTPLAAARPSTKAFGVEQEFLSETPPTAPVMPVTPAPIAMPSEAAPVDPLASAPAMRGSIFKQEEQKPEGGVAMGPPLGNAAFYFALPTGTLPSHAPFANSLGFDLEVGYDSDYFHSGVDRGNDKAKHWADNNTSNDVIGGGILNPVQGPTAGTIASSGSGAMPRIVVGTDLRTDADKSMAAPTPTPATPAPADAPAASSTSGTTTAGRDMSLLAGTKTVLPTPPEAKKKENAGVAGGMAQTRSRETDFSRLADGSMPESEVRERGASDPSAAAKDSLAETGDSLKKRRNTAGETYTRIQENAFISVTQEPLSTFSIDVDTASYANVRRFLNNGQRPPADAVRLEELINYFPYAYETPADDKPFAVQVDLAEAPWKPEHRLARIALKGRVNTKERAAANFVFLVDVSGSMNEPDKLPLVKQSLLMLTDRIAAGDHVSLVTYAGNTAVVLPSTPGSEKSTIVEAIEALGAGGSTNGAGGIRLAYEQAQKHFKKEGINRVILCTDGDFNVGISSPEELEKLITEKAKSRVFLSVLGFGTGNLKDRTMETLADKGNGNYAYIDSLSEARKVLVEQMNATLITIAKDVKIQVEFNPGQVQAYRLLGYENRALAKQDFNNDRKDAGEIGEGHTVTALYEIVPVNVKFPDGKPLVDSLRYAPKPAEMPSAAGAAAPPAVSAPAPALSRETMLVKLRYKQPEGDVSTLMEVPVIDKEKKMSDSSTDFKFAASVAGFGMLLRDSQYAGELTWDMVRELALAGKGADDQGYRGEFLQLIDKARGVAAQQ